MENFSVFKNAVTAVLQTIVLAVVLFVLYRYLLRTIGIEKLGIWSLVLASTSVTRVANLGLTGSVVKFVAKYAAYNDLKSVSKIIQTTAITVGVIVGIVLLGVYPLAPKILAAVLEPSDMPDALSILPYAFLSVWFSMLYLVYIGALDGFQRIDIRSTIVIAGTVIQAVLAIVFVQKLGLVGLALAQVIQYVVLLVASYFVLRRFVPLPLFPYEWNQALFLEMLGYGINFQVISITTILYDPVTKGLLARFGGLEMLGYYEIANRLVLQVRGLITSANQVLVPTIADLKERSPEKINRVYVNSVQIVFFLTVPIFAGLIVISPTISVAWIGTYEPTFIMATYILAVGWGANILSGPAYYTYLGIGILRWNTVEHLVMGMLNVLFGFLLGMLFGGMGVLLGWMIALLCGSFLLVVAYNVELGGSFGAYFTRSNLLLLLGAVFSIVLTVLVFEYLPDSLSWVVQFLIVTGCILTCIFIPMWQHPVRRQLQVMFATHLVWFRN